MNSSQAISRHEDFWRRFEPSENGPYIHPEDIDRITPGDRAHMKLDLLPIPVNGNLRQANVVIAMLNPGFGSGDARWGTPKQRAVRTAGELAALHQRGWSEYPLFDLNPELLGSGGANFWLGSQAEPKGKLGHVIQALAAAKHADSGERAGRAAATREVGSRVAVIQLVPYRSTSFAALQGGQRGAAVPQERLASSAEALVLLQALIDSDDKLVIIPYGVGRWKQLSGFARPNLVTYPERRRSAYIAPTSPGFQPMVERLLRPPRV